MNATPPTRPATEVSIGSRSASWPRWLALGGVGYFILQNLGVSINGGPPPSAYSSAQKINTLFITHHTGVLIAHFGDAIGMLGFAGFIAALWYAVRRVDDTGVLGVVMLLAAAIALAFVCVEQTLTAGVILQTRRLHDPALILAAFDTAEVAYVFYWLPIAVILAVPSLLSFDGRVLPRWLGWTGLALAALAVLGSLNLFADRQNALYAVEGADFIVFSLWVLAASIALFRRAGPTA
jgi:hypothetical protein